MHKHIAAWELLAQFALNIQHPVVIAQNQGASGLSSGNWQQHSWCSLRQGTDYDQSTCSHVSTILHTSWGDFNSFHTFRISLGASTCWQMRWAASSSTCRHLWILMEELPFLGKNCFALLAFKWPRTVRRKWPSHFNIQPRDKKVAAVSRLGASIDCFLGNSYSGWSIVDKVWCLGNSPPKCVDLNIPRLLGCLIGFALGCIHLGQSVQTGPAGSF